MRSRQRGGPHAAWWLVPPPIFPPQSGPSPNGFDLPRLLLDWRPPSNVPGTCLWTPQVAHTGTVTVTVTVPTAMATARDVVSHREACSTAVALVPSPPTHGAEAPTAAPTVPTTVRRVAYTAPSPVRRACSLHLEIRRLRRAALLLFQRRQRRRSLQPEKLHAVSDGGFEAPSDVAQLCTHPTLQAFVQRATARRVRMDAPGVRLLGRPRTRLFLFLGDVQPSGTFFSHVHSQFVDVLKPRLQACPDWQTQTKRFTERFDFHYRNGLVAQTLFAPQDPFLNHRIVVQQPVEAVLLQLQQPCKVFPQNVCLQQVHEVPCEVPCLQTTDLQQVDVRHIHAFCNGAWIYRVIKCWKGDSLSGALHARQVSPARIEISIELLHKEYRAIHDQAYTVASALLKVRDLVNSSVLEPENAHFDPEYVRAARVHADGGVRVVSEHGL